MVASAITTADISAVVNQCLALGLGHSVTEIVSWLGLLLCGCFSLDPEWKGATCPECQELLRCNIHRDMGMTALQQSMQAVLYLLVVPLARALGLLGSPLLILGFPLDAVPLIPACSPYNLSKSPWS